MHRPVKILIVDDNNVICELLHALFQQDGHEVTGRVHSGDKVLPAVREHPPDIVVLDLRMPGRDGLEVLPELRAEWPDIHVLVISGSEEREDVEKAMAMGAIGFIRKPFNTGQVQSTMRRLAAIVQRPHYPASLAPPPESVKRVVIVDAQEGMRKLLRQVLEEGGYFVAAEAGNGLDGLMAVDREAPDIVTLDVDLPEVDGLSALNAIKACHPKVAVVVVSVHADRAVIQQAIETGATGYLLKPFDPERVLDAMRRALAAVAHKA